MKGPAIRSRVLELQRRLTAARHGRELLDHRREALQREISARAASRAARLARAGDALTQARRRLVDARIEVGSRKVVAAALAQTPPTELTRGEISVAGVPLPSLSIRSRDFKLQYTLSDTAASIDRAARTFAAALRDVIAFAEEDAAVRHLRLGLARTTRRLNALDILLIPEVRRDLADVTAALDEEERDERLRTKRWLAGQRA